MNIDNWESWRYRGFSSKENEAYRELTKLYELLEAAACPTCGIGKAGAYYDNHGEVHQCQWCSEVQELKND